MSDDVFRGILFGAVIITVGIGCAFYGWRTKNVEAQTVGVVALTFIAALAFLSRLAK